MTGAQLWIGSVAAGLYAAAAAVRAAQRAARRRRIERNLDVLEELYRNPPR